MPNGRDFQLCTFMWQTQNGVCSVWYIGKCKFSVVDIFAKFALKTFCIAVTENSSLFLCWKHFQIIESVRKQGFELALFHCKHTPFGGKLRKWLRGKITVATQESLGCQSGCGNSCVLQIRRPAFVGFALCLRKNTHKL